MGQGRDGAVVRAFTSHQCGPGSILRSGVICGMSHSEVRGNRSTGENLMRTTNKLNPNMTPSLGIEPGSHLWEVGALTTAPSLHPLLTLDLNDNKHS